MKVSVVICTYARPEAAKKLLLKLKKQRYNDFEILIVCQGDSRDLEEIKELKEDAYSVSYYYEAVPNLPCARNIGIKQAKGEVILFLDDDTSPDEFLIEAHAANYIDSSVGVVGGRVLGQKNEQDVPDSKVGMMRKFDGYTYGGFHKGIKRSVMQVRGVNMSVRRTLALDIGCFDERFEGTAEYEDADFCLRVSKKGYKIIFDPAAALEHFNLPSGGCRTTCKEKQVYWLYRNHSLMFLNNFNKLFYPILISEYIFRMLLRSIRWRNPGIIRSVFQGILDGWKAHYNRIL